jgi:hypothetical protein
MLSTGAVPANRKAKLEKSQGVCVRTVGMKFD